MDQQLLATMRERLLAERAQLASDKSDISIIDDDEQDDAGATNHPADQATDMFLRERNSTLNQNVDEIITEIDAALARIDNGTYGICERTGESIPIERLEALPYARYTIEGQRQIEQERAS